MDLLGDAVLATIDWVRDAQDELAYVWARRITLDVRMTVLDALTELGPARLLFAADQAPQMRGWAAAEPLLRTYLGISALRSMLYVDAKPAGGHLVSVVYRDQWPCAMNERGLPVYDHVSLIMRPLERTAGSTWAVAGWRDRIAVATPYPPTWVPIADEMKVFPEPQPSPGSQT